MAKRNFYIKPETYSVLLSSTKSQEAAKARHALKESYGVPDMLKDFGHGVGKAYSEMNKYEKGLFWLFIFSMGGVVADNVANEGKYTKPVKDKLEKVYEKIVKKTPAVVIGADSVKSLAPTPAPTVMVNGSAEEEYHFSPGIIVHGSDIYKEKIQKALDFIKETDMAEYLEVMLYLEVITDGPDGTVGKGVYTIPELALDRGGPSVLIHEKEHEKQNLEPTYSQYYKGKSGWYMELDAVKKQVDWEAKAYNYTEGQKLQRFNMWIKLFEGAYPKEYAQFISEN